MKLKPAVAIFAIMAAIGVGAAFANNGGRNPVDFFNGHWHDQHGDAHGAPAHGGGLDANGCHNKSVPYHCH